MRFRCALAVLCGSLAVACDAVPDLYAVVDGSVDATVEGATIEAGSDDGSDEAEAGLDPEAAVPEACSPVSCPACAPSPGTCCDGGVACYGAFCAASCAGCAACPAGTTCCSKKNGKPGCRPLEAGPCP